MTNLLRFRKDRAALVLVFALVGCGTAFRRGYSSQYDEFTRTNRDEIGFWYQPEQPFATEPGTGTILRSVPGGPGVMLLSSSRDRWRYLDCHQVDMLADALPVALPEATHSGSVHGGVTEIIRVDLSDEVMTRMSRATSIRIRICNDVFQVDRELPVWIDALLAAGATPTPDAAALLVDAARAAGCDEASFTRWDDHRTARLDVCGTVRRYAWSGTAWHELPTE